MRSIEVLGTGVIPPAFVVGFGLGGSSVRHLDALPWLTLLDQQVGGVCMTY